jgi:hypothetical protein
MKALEGPRDEHQGYTFLMAKLVEIDHRKESMEDSKAIGAHPKAIR